MVVVLVRIITVAASVFIPTVIREVLIPLLIMMAQLLGPLKVILMRNT